MSGITDERNIDRLAYAVCRSVDVSVAQCMDAAKAALRLELNAILSSPGKDGGQEVEAVAWSERENAFTDFWEQCPKLADASDVGKARQAFMAGMDAASFFDGPATNDVMDAVANFLKERDEAVLPDEIDDDERKASARCILRIIGKASSQPTSTAVIERLTKALEPFAVEAAKFDPQENDDDFLTWGTTFTIGNLREARSALASLKAKSPSSDRAASEGWQSIETAPKDGTKILLCLTGYQPVVGYFDGERWEYQDCGDFAEEDHWVAWQELTGEWFPDNWMPLPAPPAIAEAKGSGQ